MGSVAQNLPLAGKVAIVTGASRGIGASIALELANRGARVAVNYTSESSAPLADALVTQINNLNNGSSAVKIRANLSLNDEPKKLVAETLSAFSTPHIDILVNNAGISLQRPLLEITPEDYDSVFNINVRGTLFTTQAVVPHLRAPGRIINLSSMGARVACAGYSIYTGSKGAVETITKTLSAELGSLGHTVNAVSPGITETDLVKEHVPQKWVDVMVAGTPLGRLGTCEDSARVVAWLAEPQAAWVTGQCIQTSGGFYMA